jgi:pimeloyl-ACP methyl ester carboxylesterase
MDELALFDRAAQLDFITNKTGQPSVAAIGHSQGCTLSVMLLAMRPDYIDKLWLLMLLGPVTHSEYIQTPFLRQQAKIESAQVGGGDTGAGRPKGRGQGRGCGACKTRLDGRQRKSRLGPTRVHPRCLDPHPLCPSPT